MADVNPYQSPRSGTPLAERPYWVRWGLWGLPTRKSALAFVILSIGLAAGAGIASIWYPPVIVGTAFLLSAWWYWVSIRWVDRNGGWPKPRR